MLDLPTHPTGALYFIRQLNNVTGAISKFGGNAKFSSLVFRSLFNQGSPLSDTQFFCAKASVQRKPGDFYHRETDRLT